MSDELISIQGQTEDSMHKAIQFLESELIKIRAGKANPQMLDGLSVDYYGSPMSISQVANVSVLMHVR